jgi:hypothetical protein
MAGAAGGWGKGGCGRRSSLLCLVGDLSVCVWGRLWRMSDWLPWVSWGGRRPSRFGWNVVVLLEISRSHGWPFPFFYPILSSGHAKRCLTTSYPPSLPPSFPPSFPPSLSDEQQLVPSQNFPPSEHAATTCPPRPSPRPHRLLRLDGKRHGRYGDGSWERARGCAARGGEINPSPGGTQGPARNLFDGAREAQI